MSRPRNFIFGPVPSRRLGRSLGIDVIPAKICTLDCIYCEVGPTTARTAERRDYIPPGQILSEMREVLPWESRVDWVTFTGSGEPTLHASLGSLIASARQLSPAPVAVLTNGTLLFRPDVQDDLLAADAVLPSLDAVTPEMFRKLNRPVPGLEPELIVRGLESFRRRYHGQLWLEILLVEGFNDRDSEVEALRLAAGRIHPDKIHLNTVVRPPAYTAARPVDGKRLEEIAALLGERCEVACQVPTGSRRTGSPAPDDIAAMLSRRPMTAGELALALEVCPEIIEDELGSLLLERRLRKVRHEGKTYYETPRGADAAS